MPLTKGLTSAVCVPARLLSLLINAQEQEDRGHKIGVFSFRLIFRFRLKHHCIDPHPAWAYPLPRRLCGCYPALGVD